MKASKSNFSIDDCDFNTADSLGYGCEGHPFAQKVYALKVSCIVKSKISEPIQRTMDVFVNIDRIGVPLNCVGVREQLNDILYSYVQKKGTNHDEKLYLTITAVDVEVVRLWDELIRSDYLSFCLEQGLSEVYPKVSRFTKHNTYPPIKYQYSSKVK